MRVALYWVFASLAIALMLLCGRIMFGPARVFYTHFDDMWFHHGPALIAAFLLLPVVLVDVLKLSNRFVGPILRLRTGLRALAMGETVPPMKFRDGDFWQEFATEFNVVAAQINRLRDESAQETEQTEELAVR